VDWIRAQWKTSWRIMPTLLNSWSKRNKRFLLSSSAKRQHSLAFSFAITHLISAGLEKHSFSIHTSRHAVKNHDHITVLF